MLKSLLKLIVPDIFFLCSDILKGVIGNITFKHYHSKIIKSKKLVVLGNGPSINKTLEKYSESLKKSDCIAVNMFASSKLYEKLKPRYYVLVDHAFFAEEKYVISNKNIVNTIHNIESLTTWEMTVIVPSVAYSSYFIKNISKNKNVKIEYFNNKGNYQRLTSWRLLFKLWDNNLMTLPGMNVLNSALVLAIRERVHEIYLAGADSTWIENYHLDQESNILYINDSHFYGEKNYVQVFLDANKSRPSHLHLELAMVSEAFKNYWLIKEYADYAGVRVYNASEYSLIDAFERKKLS